MIYPSFLKEKSIIGITAPSDGITNEVKIKRLDSAIEKFQELGYQIVETNNVRNSIKGKSSESREQARQLEELFLKEDVDAIFCVAGGDFLLEMLSFFDFSSVLQHPKWLQGYSDPTGLLFTITTNLDIATIYGDNFKTFGMRPWHSSLQNNLEILKGNIIEQKSFSQYEGEYFEEVIGIEPYHLTKDVYWKNLNGDDKVQIKGRMIGGCIDLLSELFGTRYDKTKEFIEKYKKDGILWYFDNCELSSEGLIRTLWKFREHGWFEHCNGIVFGRSMTESSYYDISLEEALHHALDYLEIPIIINVDIGHISPRMTIINGAIATVESHGGKGSIKFELK